MFCTEATNVTMQETSTYPISALLSDIGGAAGLFLGLNVIGIWDDFIV